LTFCHAESAETAKSTAELCEVRMRQRRLELEAERGGKEC